MRKSHKTLQTQFSLQSYVFEVLCMSMVAPVRKGEQVTARGHRLGGRCTQTLLLMLLDSSMSVSPHPHLHAAQDDSSHMPGVCSSQRCK